MSGYLIVDIAAVRDPELYAGYRSRVSEGLEAAGGRYLVRGGAIDVLHGRWAPGRVVVVRFPSLEATVGWWTSPGYAALKDLRQRATHTRMLVSADREPQHRVPGSATLPGPGAAPGYLLVEVVHDAPRLSDDGLDTSLQQSVAQSGGRVLCRGDIVRPLEDNWAPRRIALMRFGSLEAVRSWWMSPASLACREALSSSADANVVAVEGLLPTGGDA